MRSWTALVIGGAIVVVMVIAVMMRIDSEPQPTRSAPAAAVKERVKRSVRVRDRLQRMRRRYDDRQAAARSAQGGKRSQEVLAALAPAARPPAEMDEDDAEELAEVEYTLLNDPDPDERMAAAFDASTLDNDREAIRILKSGMNDPDAEVRLSIVEALGDYTDKITVGVLDPALNDPDAEVRFEAVGILGDMETREALAAVRTALTDPDEDVRDLAEGIIDLAED